MWYSGKNGGKALLEGGRGEIDRMLSLGKRGVGWWDIGKRDELETTYFSHLEYPLVTLKLVMNEGT